MSGFALPQGLTAPASDLPRISRVPLTVLTDAPTLHRHFADAIAAEIRGAAAEGRRLALILPVGPRGQYAILAEMTNREGLSWKHVHVFHMDEYCDWKGDLIAAEDPLSFRGWMERHFYAALRPELAPAPGQVHFPDPRRLAAFPEAIAALGGIQSCYGGIGVHGHVAFNEPPRQHYARVTPDEFRRAPTRLVALMPETLVLNSIRANGGLLQAFPPMSVTVGMAEILAAGRIRLYCDGGEWQRTTLRMALLGDPTVDYPVTLLQGHRDYGIVATAATAEPPVAQA